MEFRWLKFDFTYKEAKAYRDPNIFVLSLTFICVRKVLVTFQKKINLVDGSTFSKVETNFNIDNSKARPWAVSSISHKQIHHNISLPALYRLLNPLI
jgi:hypothetical protein